MTRHLAFDPADEQTLATARERDQWQASLPSRQRPQQITVSRLGTVRFSTPTCACKERITDERPGVTVHYDNGALRFHVDCLKTLLGVLGSEPDRLAQLGAARSQRRLTRT